MFSDLWACCLRFRALGGLRCIHNLGLHASRCGKGDAMFAVGYNVAPVELLPHRARMHDGCSKTDRTQNVSG